MKTNTEPTPEHFTYLGDLVGISSLYASSPEGAYNALNDYYNEVFFGLQDYYTDKEQRKIEMFSDCLIITGDDPDAFIKSMSAVYGNLISKGLLLRGGMVTGSLDFDMRVTASNFKKRLPSTDVLARTVSLERMVKGARFLVESAIAERFMAPHPAWLTPQGYINDPQSGRKELVVQRSLCTLPNGGAWEVIYPVLSEIEEVQISSWIEKVGYLSSVAGDEGGRHYLETRKLLEHARVRLGHHRGHIPIPSSLE
jgi:hypothetical protein